MAISPSVVLLSAMVGSADVLHTTPCWMGLGTPSAVTLPFPMALVVPMDVTACVVTVGAIRAVNVRSSPYAVPAILVAYARA